VTRQRIHIAGFSHEADEAPHRDPGIAPLADVRVLDLTDGRLGMTGRYLADLGADVVRAEPPGGCQSRHAEPLIAGHGVGFLVSNANKRGVVVNLNDPAGREDFRELVAASDILVESAAPGTPEAAALGPDELASANPRLVHVSVTDFGRTGPLRDWHGTSDVHLALSGALARSGLPGREPLLPPEYLVYASATVQVAWTTLLAYYHRLQTGHGDHVDFSVLEALVQNLDPGFGIGGSARGALSPADLPRGRPDARQLYPIFPCADGWVRLCLLSSRQWRGMWRWLGEPGEFADAEYDHLSVRFAAAPRIYPLIEKLFTDKTRAQIAEEGQDFGVPAAELLDTADVLGNEHFADRGAFADVEVAPGLRGRLPSGFVEMDGRKAGFRRRAPLPGEHDAEVRAAWSLPRERTEAPPGDHRQPFAGLRVLDLGVIVVGAELGRLFADHGADVIKIESRAYPDGIRQSDHPISPNSAWGHRNKRSLGLNLRTDRGRELFLRLVEHSDVVLSNFKPGTLSKLGLGYAKLAAVNPRIIVADSSAFGPTGCWRDRLGYGPLVRAAVGLSTGWRYPDDEQSFSDAITVYPDHVAARVSAVAVLAKLLERDRTGRGGTVSVSQAEVILAQLSESLLLESLEPGSLPAVWSERGGDAPRGVFPCWGDDEWCVVDVGGDLQFRALCRVLSRDGWPDDERFRTAYGRVAHSAEIRAAVESWTRQRPPREAAWLLQEAGVPAAYMQRVQEQAKDPQLAARDFLVTQSQPQFDGGELPALGSGAICRQLPGPLLGPAPLQAEHTREVVAEVLGLSRPDIEDLVEAGVLEVRAGVLEGRS